MFIDQCEYQIFILHKYYVHHLILLFQIELFKVHASQVLDYHRTVEKTIEDNVNIFVEVFTQLLTKNDKLDQVEKKYSPIECPWIFLAYGASILAKPKPKPKTKTKKEKFFIIDAGVSKWD